MVPEVLSSLKQVPGCAAWSRLRRARGFTLIELIIYIVIVSVVILIAVALSIDLLRGRARSASLETVNQNTRLVLDRLTTVIRNADLVNAANSVFGSSPGRLSLKMPSAPLNPTVFDVSGGALQIKEGTGNAVPLTSSDVEVTGLTFTHLNQAGSEGIRIQLTLRRQNPRVERTYVAGAILR